MRADDFEVQYYDPGQDNYGQAQPRDTRKVRLTLHHLNKLKKMRAAQDLENHMRMDTLEIIYGAPEAEAGGGLGGM